MRSTTTVHLYDDGFDSYPRHEHLHRTQSVHQNRTVEEVSNTTSTVVISELAALLVKHIQLTTFSSSF